jgi:hypothetical protein
LGHLTKFAYFVRHCLQAGTHEFHMLSNVIENKAPSYGETSPAWPLLSWARLHRDIASLAALELLAPSPLSPPRSVPSLLLSAFVVEMVVDAHLDSVRSDLNLRLAS